MHARHCARRAGMIARISFLGLLVSPLSAQVGESQGRGMGFSGTAARCGPVTEFFNQNVGGGTDLIFWSVTRNCISGANGCVMSLANGVAGPNSPGEGGGASGIIIDNNSLSGQASSIYFSTETVPLNAAKLTQQNLN
jgi:hypothetical protein